MEKTSQSILKIAVTGSESTGKSTLCADLATHFNGFLLPEYARTYLENLNRKYTYDDILHIAKTQLEQEKILTETILKQDVKNAILFVDTELINIKIWLQYYNYEVPEWIETGISAQNYNLYLLTDIDMPWVSDALREHPTKRSFLFQRFIEELNFYNKPYHVISGIDTSRTQAAVEVLKGLV